MAKYFGLTATCPSCIAQEGRPSDQEMPRSLKRETGRFPIRKTPADTSLLRNARKEFLLQNPGLKFADVSNATLPLGLKRFRIGNLDGTRSQTATAEAGLRDISQICRKVLNIPDNLHFLI